MFNSEEEYNYAMSLQAEAEHDMEMAAQAAEGEAEQAQINAEATLLTKIDELIKKYETRTEQAYCQMDFNAERIYKTILTELIELK